MRSFFLSLFCYISRKCIIFSEHVYTCIHYLGGVKVIDILLLNGTVVTVNKKREIIEDGAVAIKGDKIVDIGLSKILAEKYSDAKTKIDATGKVLFPGLINTHNHLFQSLLKGLGDDRVLSDWLVQVMFPSAAKLTSEEATMVRC